MAMVVKNNMSAVRTLNTLNQNSSALSKSLSRVSSGMKINSAQDDAAGYAISERMRVRIRSLDQANQNTQNDSSLMKTAEGAVANTVELLRALKEKAINAANDSNTDEDRQTIQKELNQFIDQIDDNALVQFNGKYLVDGSKNNAVIDTKTILLNQSLKAGTAASDALTSMANRAGDSLGIQTTDKWQVSWVQNGTIHTSSGNVGTNSLKDIISESVKTTDADGNEVEAGVVAATSPEGLIGTADVDRMVDKFGFKDSGMTVKDGEYSLADLQSMFSGVDFSTLNGAAPTNAIVDPETSLTVADQNAATIQAKLQAVFDTTAVDGQVTNGTAAEAKYQQYDEANDAMADIDATGVTVTAKQTVTSSGTSYTYVVEGLSTEGIDVYENAETSNKYAEATGVTYGSSDTSASHVAEALGVDESVITALQGDTTGKSFADLGIEGLYVNANNGVTPPTADSADDYYIAASGTTGANADKYIIYTDNTLGTPASGKFYNENPYYKDPDATEPTVQDKFEKAVYTPDKTEGVAFVANDAGVNGQISGLTINILDQDGNVKKAANAALDQFKQYQRAENKTGDMSLNFHIGSEANVAIKVGLGDMRSEALGLKGSNGERILVTTKENANAAINVIENALTKALDQQTTIGAIEARLEYTSTNLTTSSENVQAAESTIRDADMAKEMTNYTKNNVLLQAAQAMLAQANQNSSAVLSLLQ